MLVETENESPNSMNQILVLRATPQTLSRMTQFVVVLMCVVATTFSNAVALLGLGQGGAESHIRAGVNYRVSRVASQLLYVEPHLSAHPTNPKQLLAAVGTIRKSDGAPGLAALTSIDGGVRWAEQNLAGFELPDAGPVAIDPWTAFGPGDHAYVSAVVGSSRVRGGVGIKLFASTDGGRSWRSPVSLPFGRGTSYDHPTLAVDLSTGRFSGRLYVLASQGMVTHGGAFASVPALLRSIDGGRSFEEPARLSHDTFNNQVGTVVVMTDGTVVAPHFEMQLRGEYLEHPRLWATTLVDGGTTVDRTYLIRPVHSIPWPSLAVDRSRGPHRDRLYISWMGVERDDRVYVMASDDGGETWSDPVRVSTSPTGIRAGQRNPMVAVNGDGVVVVTWPDLARDSDDQCFQLMGAASLDGGKLFFAPTPVSAEVSCPNTPANSVIVKDYNRSVSARWPSGGDYHGLAAAADGSFHALWADSRSGAFELWTSRIVITR